MDLPHGNLSCNSPYPVRHVTASRRYTYIQRQKAGKSASFMSSLVDRAEAPRPGRRRREPLRAHQRQEPRGHRQRGGRAAGAPAARVRGRPRGVACRERGGLALPRPRPLAPLTVKVNFYLFFEVDQQTLKTEDVPAPEGARRRRRLRVGPPRRACLCDTVTGSRGQSTILRGLTLHGQLS